MFAAMYGPRRACRNHPDFPQENCADRLGAPQAAGYHPIETHWDLLVKVLHRVFFVFNHLDRMFDLALYASAMLIVMLSML